VWNRYAPSAASSKTIVVSDRPDFRIDIGKIHYCVQNTQNQPKPAHLTLKNDVTQRLKTGFAGRSDSLTRCRVSREIVWPPDIWKGNSMKTQTALVDQFNRRFTYLRLSVTDQCNFRCNYCLPDGYHPSHNDSFLSLEEIRKIATAFALNGTKKIRITGGEPTLRKDLCEIVSACKSTPGIDTVAITSNGYRITQQLPQLVDAGLDQLNLSADSLQAENFRLITGHDKLREVLAGIDLALSLGVKKVKLNVVLMREHNHAELTEFLKFVRDKPIVLRFIELMQTGDNTAFFNAQHVSGADIQEYLLNHQWLQVIRDAHAGPAVEFTHPDYAGNVGLIMPYSRDFCTSCNRLRVSARGNLHLCLFAEAHQPLRPFLTEETSEQIAERLRRLVFAKKATHGLHEGNAGSTRHLAMLGG